MKLQFAHVINVGSKTTQLGLFNFRSFLNMGMLLTESEQAKKIRSLIALKFGPSFRLGKPSNKWRYTITPYAGVTFYALSDGSNNDIGARDEYGIKESKFIGGCKLAAIYDWYYFSAHFSNRECGISVGIEFEL